jgi:hypothetical protein
MPKHKLPGGAEFLEKLTREERQLRRDHRAAAPILADSSLTVGALITPHQLSDAARVLSVRLDFPGSAPTGQPTS